jgi:hypothetical protein
VNILAKSRDRSSSSCKLKLEGPAAKPGGNSDRPGPALLRRGKSTGNLLDIEFTGLRSESDEAQ